jgi:FSR family fosmidomycin resistance protein-like MFS transporter
VKGRAAAYHLVGPQASTFHFSPFTFHIFLALLPHANLPMTAVLSVIIGFVLSSAFSAILVYAQELMPGKVGMVSGLFFGFAFGMGGIGSALLGQLIDLTNIRFVFQLCAFLPLLGLLTAFLPDVEGKAARARRYVSSEQ